MYVVRVRDVAPCASAKTNVFDLSVFWGPASPASIVYLKTHSCACAPTLVLIYLLARCFGSFTFLVLHLFCAIRLPFRINGRHSPAAAAAAAKTNEIDICKCFIAWNSICNWHADLVYTHLPEEKWGPLESTKRQRISIESSSFIVAQCEIRFIFDFQLTLHA